MTTFGDMLYQMGGVPVGSALGDIALMGGKAYHFDPTNGHADGDGTSIDDRSSNLLNMYNQLRDGYGDGVIFHGGANAWNPAATLAWAKNYTYLWGTNALPGIGNRCRIVGLAATALTVPVTIAGSGNVIRNVQFNNEVVTGTAVGSVGITAARSIFENVFAMNPSSATAASYAAKLTGSENLFHRCDFGQFTNPRAAASYSFWVTGSSLRNKFIKSNFLSWGTTVDHVLFKIATDVTSEGFVTWFEDCLFDNLNGGADLTAAIVDGATETHHQLLLLGKCAVKGCTAVANPLTYVFTHDQATTPSGLLLTVVAES